MEGKVMLKIITCTTVGGYWASVIRLAKGQKHTTVHIERFGHIITILTITHLFANINQNLGCRMGGAYFGNNRRKRFIGIHCYSKHKGIGRLIQKIQAGGRRVTEKKKKTSGGRG